MTLHPTVRGVRTALLLAAVSIAGALSAQTVTTTMRTNGVIGVFAGNSFHASQNNQAIPQQLALQDRYVRGTQALATARSVATKTASGAVVEVSISTLGRGASAGTAATSAGLPAAQRYAIDLLTSTAQFVDVICRYKGTTSGFVKATGTVSTNVGSGALIADGTTRTIRFPNLIVSAFQSSVFVDLDGQCSGSSAGTVTWNVTLEVRAVTRCTLSFGQRSCDAAGSLTGRITGLNTSKNPVIDFDTRTQPSLPPTTVTLFVSPAGTTSSKLRGFAYPSCVILTTTPIALGSIAVRNGFSRSTIEIPASVRGSIWFQSLLSRPIGNSEILSSTNTIRVDCK